MFLLGDQDQGGGGGCSLIFGGGGNAKERVSKFLDFLRLASLTTPRFSVNHKNISDSIRAYLLFIFAFSCSNWRNVTALIQNLLTLSGLGNFKFVQKLFNKC